MSNHRLPFIFLVTFMAYSTAIVACDHTHISENIQVMSLREAHSKLRRIENGIIIKHAGEYDCKCDGKTRTTVRYRIEIDGVFVAVVLVDNNKHEANLLYQKAAHVLLVFHEDRIALQRSALDLEKDIKEMEQEFGIRVLKSYAAPLDYRFPNHEKQRLFLSIEDIGERYYTSSKYLSTKFFINVSEIIPGRLNYGAESIYQKGDLRNLFLANKELFNTYKKQAQNNKKYNSNGMRNIDWNKVADSLTLL